MNPEKSTEKDAEDMYRGAGGDVCTLYISRHLTGCDRQTLRSRHTNLYSRCGHCSRLYGSSCSV